MVGEDATLTIEAGAVIHVAPDAIDEADYQGQESSVCEIILQDGASLDIQGTSGDMV